MNRGISFWLTTWLPIAFIVPAFLILGCEIAEWSGSSADCIGEYQVRYMSRFNDRGSEHDHVQVHIDAAEVEAALGGGAPSVRVPALGSSGQVGGHDHEVRLSVENVASLDGGGRLSLETVEAPIGEHTHVVFSACKLERDGLEL